MKNFYVIGNPIKHSLSPIIFNYWFKKYKISKTYKKKSIEINFFSKRFEKMINSKSFGGANITIPFKEKAIDHVDVVDAHSKKIGAINCIYKKKSKIYGTNTDWVGFYKLIKPYFKKNPTKKKTAQPQRVVPLQNCFAHNPKRVVPLEAHNPLRTTLARGSFGVYFEWFGRSFGRSFLALSFPLHVAD